MNDRSASAAAVVDVLGVRVSDMTLAQAVCRVEALVLHPEPRARSIFFVNAHTLNVASEDPGYRACLNGADVVFGDGTGVRWAARMRGWRLLDNVNGTDLVPALLRTTAGRGYRYYLLGGTADTIERAARRARDSFPGWELCGFRDGYMRPDEVSGVVAGVNAARPHLLLVGMGNPLQERWIAANQASLSVPVCMAVGGLFDHWAGNLRRASPWVRRIGFEWLQLLLQQPHKFQRYVLGNPKFLVRAARWAARGASQPRSDSE